MTDQYRVMMMMLIMKVNWEGITREDRHRFLLLIMKLLTPEEQIHLFSFLFFFFFVLTINSDGKKKKRHFIFFLLRFWMVIVHKIKIQIFLFIMTEINLTTF